MRTDAHKNSFRILLLKIKWYNSNKGGVHMNILHLKYAVEVARVGSLGQAAQNLILAQPNLSRSIKELEADVGIKIFERSTKGMVLTPEGEEFIGHAKEILTHIEQVELIYKAGAIKKTEILYLRTKSLLYF